MTQLAILFPDPMTAKQLAAAAELERMVTRTASSFSSQQYRKHRQAAKLGWKRRRGEV